MIYLAQILQETDSFSPVLTTREAFEREELSEGADVLLQTAGRRGIHGFADELGDSGGGGHLKPLFSARALPGGRVADEVLVDFRGRLVKGLRGISAGDTLFLGLHGAMCSESVDDAEGDLLRAARRVTGPDVRVVVLLDHHANVTHDMMACADVVIGYETQPHDAYGAGRKTARVLQRIFREDLQPATVWHKLPMIAPQDRFLTTCPGPMREWFDLAREAEQNPDILAASLFPMQPWLDVAEGGWCVVVHAVNPRLAERTADRLAEKAWACRDAFWVSERVSPAEAVHTADLDNSGLTVISDTGDAVFGGAPGDSTILLSALLDRPPASETFLPLVDPLSVDIAYGSKIGTTLSLTVGAAVGGTFYSPLRLTGALRGLAHTERERTGWGMREVGRTALVEIGKINLVLMEFGSYAINDPVLYTRHGLRIEDAGSVVLKTGSNFQAFAPWRKRLVRADTAGMTQSRLQDFTWRHLPRPIYPFEDVPNWR